MPADWDGRVLAAVVEFEDAFTRSIVVGRGCRAADGSVLPPRWEGMCTCSKKSVDSLFVPCMSKPTTFEVEAAREVLVEDQTALALVRILANGCVVEKVQVVLVFDEEDAVLGIDGADLLAELWGPILGILVTPIAYPFLETVGVSDLDQSDLRLTLPSIQFMRRY